MADLSDSRSPREDGAEEQNSFSQQVRGWLRSLLGVRGGENLRHSIEELIEDSEADEPSLGAGERSLLTNILDLRDRTVSDAMVPRADIVAVPLETTLPDLIQRFSEEAHSRMPVYDGDLDEVIGMIHIKDVLDCVAGKRDYDLRALCRDVLIVAPSMKVMDLLLTMRQQRQHLALVVDEFGGIDGLVSFEDLVEEIVGEIEDEHDPEEPALIQPQPDGSLIVDARVPMEDFAAQAGPLFEPEEMDEVDTLGGLVFSLAGRVPAAGEVLHHPSGVEFLVLEADPRRIRRLQVRNLPRSLADLEEEPARTGTGG